MWNSLFFVFMHACSTSKLNQSEATQPKDEIVFVVFRISHNTVKQKSNIEVLDLVKTDGTFKEDYDSDWDYGDFLTFEVIEKDKIVRHFTMEHPLYKRVEYDEDGEMKSKNLKLTQEDFFIRIQAKMPEIKLKIYETINSVGKKELATIKI